VSNKPRPMTSYNAGRGMKSGGLGSRGAAAPQRQQLFNQPDDDLDDLDMGDNDPLMAIM
jgi:hypothetical protein